MHFEARFWAAAVRYASVAPGFLTLEIHGRGTDGKGGSGYADRLPGFWPLTCHFRVSRCPPISFSANNANRKVFPQLPPSRKTPRSMSARGLGSRSGGRLHERFKATARLVVDVLGGLLALGAG